MKDQMKIVKKMNCIIRTDHPIQLLETIAGSADTMSQCALNHANTSSASTASQMIAMMVLVEGSEGKSRTKYTYFKRIIKSIYRFYILYIKHLDGPTVNKVDA